MTGALSGRTAIVTGASSGIGLGIARKLTADGARVFAATRSKNDLEKVFDQVDVAGGFVGELQQAGVADGLMNT
ncbi:MAG: 2,3-dihydroxy-2,3-dihydro-p-cumate dehydrogenase, partial [Streptomyces sp.]|nr:2,3-dihydroxy-2,3-dihydro-p-cumate dehydrogenase [Streptomyces sp.]